MADVSSVADLLPPAGDELCVQLGSARYSRTEVRDRAGEIGRALTSAGLRPGAEVGVMISDGADIVAALFAVWRSGGVVVPINPRITDTELDRLTEQLELAAVITSAQHAARVRDGASIVVDGVKVSGSGLVGRGPCHDPAVAIVSFTSGTTGTPKPVPLLHARILEGLDQVLATLRTRPSGGAPMPNLVPVSMSLWAGIYQVLFAFRVGAPVILMDGFDTLEFADLVRRNHIRSTVLPPAAMVMLADDDRITDLVPLKYVRSISSPLSPLQARRFRDRFGISVLNGYGQTELGGEVVGWSAEDARAHSDGKLGAVGRPHTGVEVRTDDRTGELLVRIPGRHGEWHHTGDIARIDDDGFVWIEGRISDMINRGGLKIHPAEVEEVLRLSPSVADAAVVGVPDARLGEVPVAFVVEAAPVDKAGLEAWCRAHLAPYKVPIRFERIDALPRNEAGKVLKRDLQPPRPDTN